MATFAAQFFYEAAAKSDFDASQLHCMTCNEEEQDSAGMLGSNETA